MNRVIVGTFWAVAGVAVLAGCGPTSVVAEQAQPAAQTSVTAPLGVQPALDIVVAWPAACQTYLALPIALRPTGIDVFWANLQSGADMDATETRVAGRPITLADITTAFLTHCGA